jgi:molybdate transport system substrate-binding protein
MKRRLLLGMAGGAVLGACRRQPEGGSPLRIAVAASLRQWLDEAVPAFERAAPGTTVRTSFGSSGGLLAQLRQRAPFDVFLSADIASPAQLAAEGLSGPVFVFATGRLVLWARRASGLEAATRGPDVLTDARVVRVALANPRLAPYGAAAEQALTHWGLRERVQDRLVMAENAAQAAQFVESGAAQVALLPLSLTVAPALRENGDIWPVPDEAHDPIRHGGVLIPAAEAPAPAIAFRDWLLGTDGQAMLGRYGFSPPPAT